MSGRVFQNIVLQFKDAVDTEIGVIDAEGTVIACTELSEIGSHWNELVNSINDAEESVIPVGGKTSRRCPAGTVTLILRFLPMARTR